MSLLKVAILPILKTDVFFKPLLEKSLSFLSRTRIRIFDAFVVSSRYLKTKGQAPRLSQSRLFYHEGHEEHLGGVVAGPAYYIPRDDQLVFY